MALGYPLIIPVPEIDAVMADYTSIRVYRSSSQGGTYTLQTTITLVADDTVYSYQDLTGSATDWARYSFYNTSTLNESALSEPVPYAGVPVYTRETLRRLVANRLRLFGRPRRNHTFPGPSGTTTGAGSTSTVVCDEYVGTRYSSDAWKGWMLLATSGSADGQEREVTSFAEGTGTFTTDIFANAVDTGATFDLYGEFTSTEWTEFVNEALLDLWLPFRFPIAGVLNQREYPLPEFITDPSQIKRMVQQTGETINEHQYTPGQQFDIFARDGGGWTMYMGHGLPENSIWYLEGIRNPSELTSDSSTIALNDQLLRLVTVTGAQKAAASLAMPYSAADDREMYEQLASRLEIERRALADDLQMFHAQHNVRTSKMVAIGGYGTRARPYYGSYG